MHIDHSNQVEGGVKADDEGKAEDEGEGGGGKVDMKALAKTVDVAEIEKVLKVIIFSFHNQQRLTDVSAPE